MAASLSTLDVAADNNGCFPFSPSSSSTTTSRTTTTTCLCYSSSKPLLSFRCSTSPAPLRANPPPILPRTFLLSPFQPLLRTGSIKYCYLPEKFRGAALHVAAASAAAVAELDEEEEVKEAEAASSQTAMTPKKGKAALPLKRDRSRSKRFLEIQKLRENKKEYDLPTAVFLLKQTANTKFLETVEAHFRLNIDPKYNDQQLRATVIFPKGTGQTVRIAVLAQGDKIEEAKNAGADIFGGDDLIQQIKDGFLEFDKLIATPDMMAKVASLGKLLGPRGLMPNPKAGTVTNDLPQTIAEFKKGKIEYRVDKTGIVHVPFGKANFSQEDLIINLVAAIKSVEANKPSGARGVYWRSVHICSSMGPSIRLNVKEMLDYKPTFT